MLCNHLHVGMRSNTNITTLIQLWQGKRFAITMALPTSLFTDQMYVSGGASSSAQPTIHKMQMVTIVTGKFIFTRSTLNVGNYPQYDEILLGYLIIMECKLHYRSVIPFRMERRFSINPPLLTIVSG